MKRFNKKGFTIVELVIVIAVIGILAGVLIPTFSSITQKAQQSAALQEATAGRNAVLALTSGVMPEESRFYVGKLDTNKKEYKTDFVFEYKTGAMNALAENADTAPKAQDEGNKTYICYIAASQAEQMKEGNNGKVTDYVWAIVKLAGWTDGAGEPSVAVGTGNYVVTWGTGDNVKTVNVYYSSDVKDSLIIFLGK